MLLPERPGKPPHSTLAHHEPTVLQHFKSRVDYVALGFEITGLLRSRYRHCRF
jgi:hypothetical protein